MRKRRKQRFGLVGGGAAGLLGCQRVVRRGGTPRPMALWALMLGCTRLSARGPALGRRQLLSLAGLALSPLLQRPPVVTVRTECGEMAFCLDGNPKLVQHFSRLVASGFYDGTAFHAIHPEAVYGGDPRTLFGYGPAGTLVRGDYYYGKVREWGSGDEGCLRGYGQTEAEGQLFCDFSRRLHVDVSEEGRGTRKFGSLALVLGGQPGMTLMLPRRTVGSQFCIYTREPLASDSRGGDRSPSNTLPETDRHPVIGSLIAGEEVLRGISRQVVDNSYLSEKRGRSLLGSPSYARPRDIPVERQSVSLMAVRGWPTWQS